MKVCKQLHLPRVASFMTTLVDVKSFAFVNRRLWNAQREGVNHANAILEVANFEALSAEGSPRAKVRQLHIKDFQYGSDQLLRGGLADIELRAEHPRGRISPEPFQA